MEGDKSGSSATDEKTGSDDEDKPETTETEGEDGDESDEPPGEPEEAKVHRENLLTNMISARNLLRTTILIFPDS